MRFGVCVKHPTLPTNNQSTAHQLLMYHPFTGTFTGTKNITNSLIPRRIGAALTRARGLLRSLPNAYLTHAPRQFGLRSVRLNPAIADYVPSRHMGCPF